MDNINSAVSDPLLRGSQCIGTKGDSLLQPVERSNIQCSFLRGSTIGCEVGNFYMHMNF